MNLKTAKKVAALFYELHKIMRQDSDIIHAYINSDRTLDAQMQFVSISDILEIEKYAKVPIIIQGPDPEIDEPGEMYPYEVGITIESMYFFANCHKAELEHYEMPVPAEKETVRYASK